MTKLSKNDCRYKLLEKLNKPQLDFQHVIPSNDTNNISFFHYEYSVELFMKDKDKKYLATLTKIVSKNNIKYKYYYNLVKREHYYEKLNKFMADFKNSHETITEYDVDSFEDLKQYLIWIERRFQSKWLTWRHEMNRIKGIRLFDNKNANFYNYCSFKYCDEEYKCPKNFIISFYKPISRIKFHPFIRKNCTHAF